MTVAIDYHDEGELLADVEQRVSRRAEIAREKSALEKERRTIEDWLLAAEEQLVTDLNVVVEAGTKRSVPLVKKSLFKVDDGRVVALLVFLDEISGYQRPVGDYVTKATGFELVRVAPAAHEDSALVAVFGPDGEAP